MTGKKNVGSACRLGRLCANPQCPSCFPVLGQLQEQTERQSRGTTWQTNDNTATKINHDGMIELVVALCTRTGAVRHVLETIRCRPTETLQEIRNRLVQDRRSISLYLLPTHFLFLRIVHGQPVPVQLHQETGRHAFQARHFVSSSRLMIFEIPASSSLQQNNSQRSTEEITQIQDPMIDFRVRLLLEGTKDPEGEILGVIRIPSGATLTRIREYLAEQLPSTPSEYCFLRMLQGEVIKLTRVQEEKNLWVAFDFAPPYATRAEIVISTQKCYTEGEIIEDETKTRELKSLASPLLERVPRNPVDMVKEKAVKYINAFLNSAGGVLIFGANDSGVIERVPIYGNLYQKASLAERVRRARVTKNAIRKLVDGFAIQMDPPVDDDLVSTVFVPVRQSTKSNTLREDAASLEEIYNVIEIHVKMGRRSLYFVDKYSILAYERRDGSTHAMDRGAITDTLKNSAHRQRGTEEDKVWRGGWRQLQSSFHFDAIMRRLSDPWAGREWLFAAVRQTLFKSVWKRKMKNFGVAVIGLRGMGKTSFLSELALRPKQVTHIEVLASHLCRPDDLDTLNPALFVQSLAAMLAENFRSYKFLMSDPVSHQDGAVMLRALRKEHCDSNPDDAFARGILKPLQEIENSHPGQSNKLKPPMVIIVDAIDDSLGADSGTYSTRPRGSSTIAHLLEKGLAEIGLPSWIKLIVSFRSDMYNVPGPIQRLAQHLDIINLDSSNEAATQQAQEDIRLYAEAFIERRKMTSPLGTHVGKGKWDYKMAAEMTAKLRVERGRKLLECHYETNEGNWEALDKLSMEDVCFTLDSDSNGCFVWQGRHVLLFDFTAEMAKNMKSKELYKLRFTEVTQKEVESESASEEGVKSTQNEKGDKFCFYCNLRGHNVKECPQKVANTRQENRILNLLAVNARGNYLYARSVLEDVHIGALEWDQIPSLPQGLDHLYNRFFSLYFAGRNESTVAPMDDIGDSKPTFRSVKPVLEVLLAATKRGVTEQDIARAVVAGGACDPTAVHFCLRDIQWALDVDISGSGNFLPRYSLRHDSIRTWLRQDSNAESFGLDETHGHALLAASLLQRCWPQQRTLSRLFQSTFAETCNTRSCWYQLSGWEPNKDDEDVYNLARHLALSSLGQEPDKVHMLKTVGIDTLDSEFRGRTTATHSAASAGDVVAMKLLLAAGAAPDNPVRGRRPLHLATSRGYSQVAELLLAAGAEATARTSSGRTPLLNAAGRGSVSTVKCILRAIQKLERDPDFHLDLSEPAFVDTSPFDNGRTPLSFCCEEGYDDVITLLIDAGASVYLADRWGRTPLYY
eukprot:scaffold36446_cov176-Amphora_coffeaeformis.AAC.1